MGKKLFLSGHDPTLVAYSLVRDAGGQPWNVASGAFLTQSSGELPKYEYVLVQDGLTGYSERDFPSGIPAGLYSAEYRLRQSGVAPAWPNLVVAEKEYTYDGSAFVGRLTRAAVESAVYDSSRSGHFAAGTYGEIWLGYDGTARSGTPSSARLAADAPSASISGQGLRIVGGYGAGQLRPITYYDASSKWTSVAPNWDVVPDDTSLYAIVDLSPLGQVNVYDRGGFALASGGLDAVMVESGVNARQVLSPILAAAAGILAGAGTGTVTIKGGNVPATRITATTDNAGNRTAVTLNLPA